MTSGTVAEFETALEDLDVGWTRADPGGLEAALAGASREPVVGVPLPFDGATLPEWVRTDPTPADLSAAATGITAATFAVADYGSVVIRSTPEPTEQVSLFSPLHVAIVRAADVVPGMAEAFDRFGTILREDRSSAIIATGPSATADMGELVRGAHGPQEVHVVIVEKGEATGAEPGAPAGVEEDGR